MRLFLYGTLMEGSGNPTAAWLHDRLEPGLQAYALGRLYAVEDPQGWYPAFVPDPSGGRVFGMVHETTSRFDMSCLDVLDAYEGYQPGSPGQSEFLRQLVSVRLIESGHLVEVQVYTWANAVTENQVEIASGDFARFLYQTRRRSY